MTDEASVKAKLRQLAGNEPHDSPAETVDEPPSLAAASRQIIERATAALDDLDAAASFLEEDGLADLERAVDAADQSVSACAEQGRETLAEYRRLRAAVSGDQFHHGRGTSLGDGDKTGIR